MVYIFTIVSDETDDFAREIKIDSDATFEDFHQIILSSCNYKNDQMTSFFICNEDWEKEREITLEDMGDSSADEDVYVMRSTRLSELVEEEGQRLLYVFDPMADRVFFIELSEIEYNKNLKEAKVSRQNGEPPIQLMDFDEAMSMKGPSMDLDEDFFGSEDFDSEEFDPEGFEFTDGEPYSN
ncbi:MAG: hypothetical protein HUJ98_06905 [Bacteroidaceae bacterium]|nr:hypothetical protein [Bacteroidaceae bacterium]MCF0186199.1 hypothetical protein [Bacteroidaceae bacterium]